MGFINKIKLKSLPILNVDLREFISSTAAFYELEDYHNIYNYLNGLSDETFREKYTKTLPSLSQADEYITMHKKSMTNFGCPIKWVSHERALARVANYKLGQAFGFYCITGLIIRVEEHCWMICDIPTNFE